MQPGFYMERIQDYEVPKTTKMILKLKKLI